MSMKRHLFLGTTTALVVLNLSSPLFAMYSEKDNLQGRPSASTRFASRTLSPQEVSQVNEFALSLCTECMTTLDQATIRNALLRVKETDTCTDALDIFKGQVTSFITEDMNGWHRAEVVKAFAQTTNRETCISETSRLIAPTTAGFTRALLMFLVANAPDAERTTFVNNLLSVSPLDMDETVRKERFLAIQQFPKKQQVDATAQLIRLMTPNMDTMAIRYVLYELEEESGDEASRAHRVARVDRALTEINLSTADPAYIDRLKQILKTPLDAPIPASLPVPSSNLLTFAEVEQLIWGPPVRSAIG